MNPTHVFTKRQQQCLLTIAEGQEVGVFQSTSRPGLWTGGDDVYYSASTIYALCDAELCSLGSIDGQAPFDTVYLTDRGELLVSLLRRE